MGEHSSVSSFVTGHSVERRKTRPGRQMGSSAIRSAQSSRAFIPPCIPALSRWTASLGPALRTAASRNPRRTFASDDLQGACRALTAAATACARRSRSTRDMRASLHSDGRAEMQLRRTQAVRRTRRRPAFVAASIRSATCTCLVRSLLCRTRVNATEDGDAMAEGAPYWMLWEELVVGGAHWSGVLPPRHDAASHRRRRRRQRRGAVLQLRRAARTLQHGGHAEGAAHRAISRSGCVCYSDMGRDAVLDHRRHLRLARHALRRLAMRRWSTREVRRRRASRNSATTITATATTAC